MTERIWKNDGKRRMNGGEKMEEFFPKNKNDQEKMDEWQRERRAVGIGTSRRGCERV